MPINVRFAVVCSVAAVGLAAGLAASDHNGGGGFGVVRAVSPAAEPVNAAVPQDLAERLASIRRIVVIRPEQAGAWQLYADIMVSLDQASRAFERRVANGEVLDDGSERGRHALILTAALGDLKDSLSPEQFTRIRPLAEDLAGTLICKGLVVR